MGYPLPRLTILFGRILLNLIDHNRFLSSLEVIEQLLILLLREMEDNKMELNTVIYNIIIKGIWKAGRLKSATDFFSSLSSKGVVPNVRTYTMMINGLCNGGLLVEAEKLLREMEAKGCSPDDCTYNIIIRGFIHNNEISRAVQHIEEMKEMGFSADASTMELIIDLLSKDKVDPVLLSFLKLRS